MDTVYLICAVVGSTVLVCQFILTLFGIGGEDADHGGGGHDVGGHDVHAGGHEAAGHASTTWLFGVLTLRTIVAGFAFFGLTGMALHESDGFGSGLILLSASGAGISAIFVVYWIMRSLSSLNVDGTVGIEDSVGALGTVYLTIPGEKAGTGKVHVSVLNRTLEYKATTSHPTLPTGSQIIVVRVLGADTLEVAPVESLETVYKG